MPISGVKGLQVTSQGGRHVIFVPVAKAQALRTYLQTKGVTSSHPEIVTGETSSVEIRERDDLTKVQELLNGWVKSAAKG